VKQPAQVPALALAQVVAAVAVKMDAHGAMPMVAVAQTVLHRAAPGVAAVPPAPPAPVAQIVALRDVAAPVAASVLPPAQAAVDHPARVSVRAIVRIPALLLAPMTAPTGVRMDVKQVARMNVRGSVQTPAPFLAVPDVLINAIEHVRTIATTIVLSAVLAVVITRAIIIVLQIAVLLAITPVVLEHAKALALVVAVQVVVIPAGNVMAELIKRSSEGWQLGRAKSITFIVTKDCQLACKYCYLIGKNTKESMTWDVAKEAIDYILAREDEFKEQSVTWDFIGGEPFLEIDLIDQICDYLKREMFRLNHHWFDSYRFSFSTNGINYHTDKVQRFIEKNHNHLSIGITIDGTKRKHDLNRIWKTPKTDQGVQLKTEEEKGSYEDVVKNIPLWLEQFPGAATKVTISSADIPYVKESVLHLYELGIKEVNINCVFEDVWKDGDDAAFEQQLTELADAIIDNGLYQEHACSFFAEFIGKPQDPVRDNNNWCGAGKMLAIDAAGNFYPCTRFAAYSLRSKPAWIIGNVKDGIDQNKLRPFLTLDRTTQSKQECIDCEVASGCAWCQGENYDAADTHTVYQRSTAVCKMHKARVRANNYYWNKLFRKLELQEYEEQKHKTNKVIC